MNEAPIIGRAILIDDEEIDQQLYRRTIKRSGLVGELETFSYANKALEYLRQNKDRPVDIIFLDINMPQMNGFEFLEAATEEFGSRFAKVVVVMLTTSLDPSDVERANRYDVVRDYINKPLTIDHVKQVANLLEAAA